MYLFKIAHPADAGIVCKISRDTFYDTFYEHNTHEDMCQFLDTHFTPQNIERELASPDNTCLLMYQSGLLVGYANLRRRQHSDLGPRPAMEIGRIYIVRDKIGQGAGHALMTQCLVTARQKDAEVVWLGVWEKNVRAIRFYQKWEFEKFGEHIFILGKDVQNDWLMKKEIL